MKPKAIWILAALVASTAGVGNETALAQEKHVVVISIEGVAASRLDDESLELPNLRAITRSGVRANGSETVYPATDHPAHTTIITGVPPRVHGVLGNRLLDRETGEYLNIANVPRPESIRVPTIFDAAKAAGLTTASFFWPQTRDDPAIDIGIPLVLTGDGGADMVGSDPDFLQELRDNAVPIDLFFQWHNDVANQQSADRILTRAAAHVLTTRKPNLLLLRLPAMDRFQHQYGPDHYLSKAALTGADANVGLIRRAIENAGIQNDTTLFIVSDHGFHSAEYSLNLYPVFEQAGLASKVNLHGGYWSAVVERGEGFSERDARSLDDALSRAAALDGVAVVVRPEDFHSLGIPTYEESPYILGQYLIIGDIDTRLVIDEQETSRTTRKVPLPTPFYGHGYLPTDERMYPIFLATGRNVAQGERLGHVTNYDIAPTIAALLGMSMPGLPGKALFASTEAEGRSSSCAEMMSGAQEDETQRHGGAKTQRTFRSLGEAFYMSSR